MSKLVDKTMLIDDSEIDLFAGLLLRAAAQLSDLQLPIL